MLTAETLDVAEAAALLRAESETIMQLARKGALPGTRIGKSWVFLREDVIAFLKEQVTKDTEERRRRNAQTSARAVVVATPRKSRRTVLPALPDLPPSPTKSPKTTG
ncbi:helix-turn-helix domain-containing protein [Noviherbaspirillum sp. ST9]|uniref:helix-turn-helix domain-containing protein n=1 Tax=Noviherbaspirillum sp. ST9 TaxID=3401606 RepID=UPI003B58A88F